MSNSEFEKFANSLLTGISDWSDFSVLKNMLSLKPVLKRAWDYQQNKVEKLEKALSFYADKDNYFTKEVEIDTRDICLSVEDGFEGEAPEVLITKKYECSTRLKLDRGEIARKALGESL